MIARPQTSTIGVAGDSRGEFDNLFVFAIDTDDNFASGTGAASDIGFGRIILPLPENFDNIGLRDTNTGDIWATIPPSNLRVPTPLIDPRFGVQLSTASDRDRGWHKFA